MKCALLFAMLTLPCLASHTPAPVALPPYAREVLPNGAVLYVVPKKDTPLVNLRAVIRGGAESDPQGLEGLSSVVAALLRHGAQTQTAAAFSSQLDDVGATFDSSTDAQSTAVTMEFLSKNRDRALDLFTNAILHPTFPTQEVRKVIAQSVDSARSSKDSPGVAAALYFRALLFGPEHPYGRPVDGDELSLSGIVRSAILAYHRRMYVGRNLTLIAIGDFDQPGMRDRLATTFGQLPPGERYEWAADQTQDSPAGPRLLLVDKPGSTQTQMVIGWPGISRNSPDRIAVWLVNSIFGGGFTSMLNSMLRIQSGLSYGANCVFDQNRLTGAISMRSATLAPLTAPAVDLALSALAHLAERGITAEQLAAAKSYLEGNYPTDNLETADEVASLLGDLELFGLGRDDVDHLFERVDAVTLQQANEAVRKYFAPKSITFVLLGDAAQIRDVSTRWAPKVWEISISHPGYGIYEHLEHAPVSRASQSAAADPSAPARSMRSGLARSVGTE